MNEVRLTVNADDFGVVSQLLVDMGVGFRVEPVVATATEAKRANLPTATKTRAAGKRSSKKAKGSAKSNAALTAGAERLRDAIARTLPGSERNPPASTQPLHPTEPRDDLA